MPGPDFTEPMRRIDALQGRIDQVFQRVNADPVYRTEQTISDAISDNPRYLDSDRKAELAEIFFAILDQIYEKIVKQDTSDPFCNPAVDPRGRDRLPQTEMLMRDMMPLAWALSARWDPPDLKGTCCPFFFSFTEEEAGLFLEIIEFLAGLFPEFAASPGYGDLHEFWTNLAAHRELLREEDDEAKSRLLSVLVQKKIDLDRKRGAPEKRFIIPPEHTS